jgi:hypothetical protein
MANATMTIRDKIVSKLQAISSIQEVKTGPNLELSGFPAAVVIPSQQESDYETSNANERTYAFDVMLLYEVDEGGVNAAVDALYDLSDQVLDAFDQDPTLSGISLPAGYQMIYVTPTAGAWGEVGDRKLVQRSVNVRVRVSFSIS